MDEERREELISLGALLLVFAMLAGEVALLATHLWIPLARAQDRLGYTEFLDEEDDQAAVEQPPPVEDQEPGQGLAVVRRPSPWVWAAFAITALAAALITIAALRLHHGTSERQRWLWVLLMSGLVIVWGLLTAWLMTRQAFMFEQIINGPGAAGPQL